MERERELVHLRRLRALLGDIGVGKKGLARHIASRDNHVWADIVELVDAIAHGCCWMKICQPVSETHPAAQFITRTSDRHRTCVHGLTFARCTECVSLNDKGVDALLLTRTGTLKTLQTKNYAPGICRVYEGMSTFVMTSRMMGARSMVFSLSEGARLCKNSATAAEISEVDVVALTNAAIAEICMRALSIVDGAIPRGMIECRDLPTDESSSEESSEADSSDDEDGSSEDDSADSDSSEDESAESAESESESADSESESAESESESADSESESSEDEPSEDDDEYPDEDPADFTLRVMQAQMHDEIVARRFRGNFRFQLPCGAGKTSYAGWLCSVIRRAKPKARFAFLVPTKALADRTIGSFSRWGLSVCVVHSGSAASQAEISAADVVIAVYNSAGALLSQTFRGVFTDEAHHIEIARSTDTYRKICRRIEKNAPLHIGLSATFHEPSRCTLSFDYEEAVAEGICADIALVIPVYDGPPSGRMSALANHIRDGSSLYRKILAYCNSVRHAHAFAEVVRDADPSIRVYVVDASTATRTRQKILAAMAATDHRVMIVSVQTLCEGIDIPIADTCVFVEPRHSSIGLWQPIGRVARALPGFKTLAHVILPMSDQLSMLRKFTSELARRMPSVRRAIAAGCNNASVLEIVHTNHDYIPEATMDTAKMSLAVAIRGEWWQHAELLAAYTVEHGRMPPRHAVYQGFAVGSWVGTQRGAIVKGTLSPDRIERLQAIPHWADDPRADAWDRNHDAVCAYATEHGRMPPHLTVYQGLGVGSWVNSQRNGITKGTIAADRLERLRAIPRWTDDALVEKWDQNHDAVCAYAAEHGRMPPQGTVYQGCRIGGWISTQRVGITKGTISAERLERLRAIPHWTDDPLAESWNRHHDAVVAYAAEHGRMPPDAALYQELSVGSWVRNQRTRIIKGTFAEDQLERLRAIPHWVDDAHADSWDRHHDAVCAYVAEHGRMPLQPAVYQELRIGHWVSGQRGVISKGTISAERLARLRAIPRWTDDAHADTWDRKHDAVCAYATEHGRMPPALAVYQGLCVGSWVHVQRCGIRKGKMTPERLARLQAIPHWIDGAREDSWDQQHDAVRAYAVEHGRMPPQRELYQELRVGVWVNEQRQAIRKGKMTPDRLARLQAIPHWR